MNSITYTTVIHIQYLQSLGFTLLQKQVYQTDTQISQYMLLNYSALFIFRIAQYQNYMNSITNSFRGLTKTLRYNKIEFHTGNPYNLRWQWKWKHAYYTYPKDWYEHTYVKKPEDTPAVAPFGQNVYQDFFFRQLPGAKMYWNRRRRIMDPFQVYLLPTLSFLSWQFWPVSFGFKVLTLLPAMMFYTRMRDRCIDPDIKQTFLRDMVHNNPELGELFKPETIHVLDYDLEYDEGIPDTAKFPQYTNKLWRFFNSDSGMCTGFFKFGDLQSGATMNLKFRTMPIKGQYRYQVGEPYHFYDMRAQVSHKGTFKEIVLADEAEQLKKHRPFLFLI